MESTLPKFNTLPSFRYLGLNKKQRENFKQILTDLFTDKKKRLALVSESTFLFALYYFQEDLMKNEPEEFHLQMAQAMDSEDYDFAFFLMFRGSGKSSFIDADVLRNIYFKKVNFMLVLSAEMDNVERNLMNIAHLLQGKNQRLLNDFGPMFFKDKKTDNDELRFSQKTAITNFITKNGVKVEGMACFGDFRGLKFGTDRPQRIYLDDIETFDTVMSASKTQNIKRFLSSAIPALATGAKTIIAGNYISDNGVIAMLKKMLKDDPKTFFLQKAVIEDGESVWPDRFTNIPKEEYLNLPHQQQSRMKCLELEKERMNTAFPKSFEREMMNQPITAEGRLFDEAILEQYRELARQMSNPELNPDYVEYGNWKVWKNYEYRDEIDRYCHYLITIDPALGNGGDHTAIYVLNADTNETVARFMSNMTPTELIVKEIEMMFNAYGKPLIVFERNGVGEALHTLLRGHPFLHNSLYVGRRRGGIKTKIIEQYGVVTTKQSKQDYYMHVQTGILNQEFIVYDESLIDEMSTILLDELITGVYRKDIDLENKDGVSNHRDLFSAYGIGMRALGEAVVFGAERVIKKYRTVANGQPKWVTEALGGSKTARTIKSKGNILTKKKLDSIRKSYRI